MTTTDTAARAMKHAVLARPANLHTPTSGDSGLPPICRVVLVDPRPERRAITSLLVERCPQLSAVGVAGSLAEAEALIRAGQADVVVVEIQLPVTEGFVTIGTLRELFPDLRIVVCSFHDDAATRDTARMHGADGYLKKPFRVEEFLALVAGSAGGAG